MKRSIQMMTVFLLLAALVVVLPGCLISGDSSISESGQRISKSSLAQVEEGETTAEWVIAAFGQPSSRETWSKDDDGVTHEIWRYDWHRVKSGDAQVFLLFSGSEYRESSSTTYFEFADGVVTKYWIDESP